MQYTEILKKAWDVTWKYKALWVLGLFAYGISGGSSGGGNTGYRLDAGDLGGDWITPLQGWYEEVTSQDLLALFIAVSAVALLAVLVWWVLSKAARAGLVHLVDEAEEGRAVGLGAGWRSGFSHWWSVFVIDFLLALPWLLVAAVFVGLILLLFPGAGVPEVMAATMPTFCCGIVILVVVSLVLQAFLETMRMIAYRSVVLDGWGGTGALGEAWRLLRHRTKDVFLMWLLMFAVGIGVGMVMGVLIIALLLPVIILAVAVGPAVLIGVAVLFLALMVPSAVWNTFRSASWTVFYRQLTGRERVIEVRQPQTVPPAPPGADLPPPPPPPMGVPG